MFWYYLLILIICIDFALEILLKNKVINKNPETKTSKILAFVFKYRIITIIALVTFSTFKSYSVGIDTEAYLRWYNSLCEDKSKLFVSSAGNKIELGYTFINSIFALINAPFRLVLFVISLFVSITLVLFVNKISPNKFMSIILYVALGVFAQSLSANRQILAMAILLIALMLLIDKKLIKAAIVILSGALFHVSILVCLVLVPLRFIKPKWYIIVGMFALSIIVGFYFPSIIKIVSKIFGIDYYSDYYIIDPQYIIKPDLVNMLYSIGLIIVFIVLYISKYKILRLDEKQMELYNYFILIFAFVPVFRIVGFVANLQQLLNRVNMYFFLSLLILIPLFVKGLKHNKKLYIISNIMVYLVAGAYMYYLYAIKLSCGVVPFVFAI